MNHKYLLQWSLFSLLLLAVLGILGNAEAGLVEVYINDSEELTESEEEFIISGGKDLNLEIRISGPYRIDGSGDENFSVESIFIDVYFDSDTDRRDATSGVPQYKSHDGLDPGYDRFISVFSGNDSRFVGYEGPIRFSIVMKNESSDIIWASMLLITITSPASSVENSSESVIYDNPIILGGVMLAFILFSVLSLYLGKGKKERKMETERKEQKDMESQMKLRESQRKSEEEQRNERVQKRRAMRHQANERERALDYDSAIEIWEELGQIDQAARVRKLKAEQNAVKIDQTVIHGDYVDDRDTIVKDSVVNRSSIGASEDGKLGKIKELKKLHDSGTIDDDEFKKMKKEILGK